MLTVLGEAIGSTIWIFVSQNFVGFIASCFIAKLRQYFTDNVHMME